MRLISPLKGRAQQRKAMLIMSIPRKRIRTLTSAAADPPAKRPRMTRLRPESGERPEAEAPLPAPTPEVNLSPPTLSTDWVRASSTRNFMLGDLLVDWLELHGLKAGLTPDEKSPGYDQRLDFRTWILERGRAWESHVMDRLRQRFGAELVEITSVVPARQMAETLDAMHRGAPLIAQGHIWEPRSRVHGHPDLLVRSDYLDRLVQTPVTSGRTIGCRWSPDWHYRVVDIKFMHLALAANFTTLLNHGSTKACKAQVCVYNVCLCYLQGYDPGALTSLGRGWEGTRKRQTFYSDDPWFRLGVVDFNGPDQAIITEAAEGVQWIRRCRMQGAEWKILPQPSVPELYPNMCNEVGTGWDRARNSIAIRLREITLVWQCGRSEREGAHEQGIFTWDDPRLTAAKLE